MRTPLALALIAIGLVMLGIVFAAGYRTFQTFQVDVQGEGDLISVLAQNSAVLIELLIKVAFLGVSLAAGSVVLSKGADLLKDCPETR